jgi:DNA-binding response OmpR family regulator
MVTRAKTTILVVEDEPALRRTVLRALDRLGYEVVLAERAEDALARIELGQTIHLVICDLHLPTMDGLSFYERLRERGFDGRFLLTSGVAAADVPPVPGLPAGIPFLQKPWTLESLTTSVRAVLGRP